MPCSLDLSRFSVSFLFLSLSRSLLLSFFAFSYSLFCSYSLSPPSPCLPEEFSQATGYKMATVATKHDIECGTRHCYVATSILPLCFFTFSLFSSLFRFPLSFVNGASLKSDLSSFNSRLRTGSIFSTVCVASENRCTDDGHATIYRPSHDIPRSGYSKLRERIARFLVRNFALSVSFSLSPSLFLSPSLVRALSLSFSI